MQFVSTSIWPWPFTTANEGHRDIIEVDFCCYYATCFCQDRYGCPLFKHGLVDRAIAFAESKAAARTFLHVAAHYMELALGGLAV
jgi:hypothetical protein